MNLIISALVDGAQNNGVATVNSALQYDNVDRKNFNMNGSLYDSLLHVATRGNNYEICEMLLKGANTKKNKEMTVYIYLERPKKDYYENIDKTYLTYFKKFWKTFW